MSINKKWTAGIALTTVFITVVATHSMWLGAVGRFLIVDEKPVRSDAIVVLNTGLEIYPRLIQAARLCADGWAEKIVINGNRKSDVLRDLERKGFQPGCPWYEDRLRILELLGVARNKVVVYSEEDAYDTVSEAKAVGRRLVGMGMERILVVTSKYHTRRANMIWRSLLGNQVEIRTVAAGCDPFDPDDWWRYGRQTRWVMAEYGGWIYWKWKSLLVQQPAA